MALVVPVEGKRRVCAATSGGGRWCLVRRRRRVARRSGVLLSSRVHRVGMADGPDHGRCAGVVWQRWGRGGEVAGDERLVRERQRQAVGRVLEVLLHLAKRGRVCVHGWALIHGGLVGVGHRSEMQRRLGRGPSDVWRGRWRRVETLVGLWSLTVEGLEYSSHHPDRVVEVDGKSRVQGVRLLMKGQ